MSDRWGGASVLSQNETFYTQNEIAVRLLMNDNIFLYNWCYFAHNCSRMRCLRFCIYRPAIKITYGEML